VVKTQQRFAAAEMELEQWKQPEKKSLPHAVGLQNPDKTFNWIENGAYLVDNV